jgi:hypothetical protein
MRVFWIAALLWGTANLASGGTLSEMGPAVPWRDVKVLSNSHSELHQHMALGAVLVLCTGMLRVGEVPRLALSVVAVAGLALALAASGRGMKAGFAAAVLLLVCLPLFHSDKRILLPARLRRLLVFACAGVLIILLFADAELASVMRVDRFLEANPLEPQGTAYWRTLWWENLVYAVTDLNPAFGLGFGLNLSVYNPFITAEELRFWPVRSPHNFNMTVFARMGFVGAVIWAGILLSALRLLWLKLRTPVHAASVHAARREEIAFWLMALVCTWVNASFGVLMEGPVLGIFFWFALGFAVARPLAAVRREPRIRMPVQVPALAEWWSLEKARRRSASI